MLEETVGNASALVTVFGDWPSFHDAEVLEILLQRGPGTASLQALIHVFKMTAEIDAEGRYVNTNHTLVRFRFAGLELHSLKWFNHQNAIDDLEVTPVTEVPGRFSVYMPSNWGCDVEFTCESIAVLSVEPYTEEAMIIDGSVYARGHAGNAPLLGSAQPVSNDWRPEPSKDKHE